MIEAAGSTPRRAPFASCTIPSGMKGWKLAGLKCGAATATKIARATIFTATRIPLTVALSRAPTISIAVTSAMIRMAGRLTRPWA